MLRFVFHGSRIDITCSGMQLRISTCSVGDQKLRKIFLGLAASSCLFMGFISVYSLQGPVVPVAREHKDAGRVSLISQRLKPNFKTKLLSENCTKRPNARFLIEPWRINSTSVGLKSLAQSWSSIVVVKSGIQNKDRRDMIRQTWGAIKFMDGVRFETVFILGKTGDSKAQKALEGENMLYGDLLQTGIPDTTENLPLKITAGMWWVSKNVKPDWLYSSADDDIVLHPPNFARYVESLARERGGVDGATMENLPVICFYGYRTKEGPDRKSSSKWYMSEEKYPDQYWPPYCRGGWYSMPVAKAEKIYEVSRTTPILYLDDVWLTGIVRLRMYNSANEKFQTGTVFMEQGIVGAPLSDRTNKELYWRKRKDEVDKIIVSHTWGNYGWFSANVANEIKDTWEKWKPSIWQRMRDVVFFA